MSLLCCPQILRHSPSLPHILEWFFQIFSLLNSETSSHPHFLTEQKRKRPDESVPQLPPLHPPAHPLAHALLLLLYGLSCLNRWQHLSRLLHPKALESPKVTSFSSLISRFQSRNPPASPVSSIFRLCPQSVPFLLPLLRPPGYESPSSLPYGLWQWLPMTSSCFFSSPPTIGFQHNSHKDPYIMSFLGAKLSVAPVSFRGEG